MNSGSGFDNDVLAVDGMIVWTKQPKKEDCNDLNIGPGVFHCCQKDKFELLLTAGCDHHCRFRWVMG